MHVDDAEISVHLLAIKSERGVLVPELMLCRPGNTFVKTGKFFIYNRLKLLFMSRRHLGFFSRSSEKLVAVFFKNGKSISIFTARKGHKYLKLDKPIFILVELESHFSSPGKIISTGVSVWNLSGGLFLCGATIVCRPAILCAMLRI